MQEDGMSVKVGINGFGRIGRLALRECLERRDMEVMAINNRNMEIEYFAYLLRNDTVHGRFSGSIDILNKNTLSVNGKHIHVFTEDKAESIDWEAAGAEYIIESTGVNKTVDKCAPHFEHGAKKVIISAPSDDAPTFVMGVNHHDYNREMNVVSTASCTTNCLAPLCKIIHEEYGIAEGIMTTVHSMTASQNTVDGSSRRDWRGGRSATDNIIPSKTGAAKALTKVMPELKGKIHCTSLRVPTLDVSVINLAVRLETASSFEDIKGTMRDAAENPLWHRIIGYSDELAVSSDFRTEYKTCVFDADASASLNENFHLLVAWYDNEWGYTNNMLDFVKHMAKTDARK